MRWLVVLVFAISVTAKAAENLSSEAVPEETMAAISAPAEKAESEIPLNLEKNKKASEDGGSLFRILLTVSMLGILGTGAYVFLRKYSVPKSMKYQTQIKVLQQHYLGPKKSLAIVRVAGESILIGVTDHNISMIKSLSLLDDEVPEDAPQNFNKVMDKFEEVPTKREAMDSDEDFAISGVKDIVSKRLKGMRSFQ